MTLSSLRAVAQRAGETKEFSCSPREAVVCVHEQARGNWNTWQYDFSRAQANPKTVTCGDWTALWRGVAT